jgi:hypothetical protein
LALALFPSPLLRLPLPGTGLFARCEPETSLVTLKEMIKSFNTGRQPQELPTRTIWQRIKGDWPGTAHRKSLLTVLAGLSEFERRLIVARTQAGILRARELGVAFGPKPKLNTKQRRLIAER